VTLTFDLLLLKLAHPLLLRCETFTAFFLFLFVYKLGASARLVGLRRDRQARRVMRPTTQKNELWLSAIRQSNISSLMLQLLRLLSWSCNIGRHWTERTLIYWPSLTAARRPLSWQFNWSTIDSHSALNVAGSLLILGSTAGLVTTQKDVD